MRLIFFPVLLLVALIGGRLLGIRLGWWRGLLVAWLGLVTAGILLQTLTQRESPPLALVIGVGLLAMMAWAASSSCCSERVQDRLQSRWGTHLQPSADRWLAPAGRSTSPPSWPRSGLARFAPRQATQPRGSATGRALRVALERAGGVFIRLGQFLSTRPDLVSPRSPTSSASYSRRQSRCPSRSSSKSLWRSWGLEPAGCFSDFDLEPAAAASIAQVHRAVLPDGRPVAVKVQRPRVAQLVRRDLEILQRLAGGLERRTAWARDLRLSEVVGAFADNLTASLTSRPRLAISPP
jgi:ubiquinone biosynthesis protein